jgi:thiol-disulfide isomerase/thioredoxin
MAAASLLICCCAASWQSPTQDDPVDRRWLDRLDRQDRSYLETLIGYAPPAFTADLEWIGGEPTNWQDLRGRVVVIQSWTSKTAAGRQAPRRTERSLQDLDEADIQLISLHIPDGAETAGTFLKRRPMDHPVIIDRSGVFCDELGIYKRPANVVVDRNGTVRYVGLNDRGLKSAVDKLNKEQHDPGAEPVQREPSAAPVEDSVDFPPIEGTVGPAADFRGRQAPTFYVEQWLTPNPLTRDKVVVIDFWATWCGPCVAAIPHMNQLADAYSDHVAFVGLSDEQAPKFQTGLQKRNLNRDSFRYALALDPSGKMKKALQIRGIPHVIVVSSDGVVRWQGHPTRLNAQLLQQVVDANGIASNGNRDGRNRWTGS